VVQLPQDTQATIDVNPYAAHAAAESTPKRLGIAWVTGNALAYRPEKPVDIVVSSLMAHHIGG